MTKRVFEAFAQRIKADISDTRFSADEQKRTKDAAMYAAYLFADISADENPRFDRDRFIRACGLR